MGKILKALSLKKVMGRKQTTWAWRTLVSGLRWKRKDDFQLSIIDTMVFKILSVVEAIVLLSNLCFFYFRFGCHI